MRCWVIFYCIFDGTYVHIIGLKAPWNYSDQLITSVLLCEGPKPNICMNSGFLDPWTPYLLIWLHQITSNNIRQYMDIFLRNEIFAYLGFIFCQVWKRQALTNDEDPFHEIFKTMDMRPISIKKHEWNFANIVQVSITKHTMSFLKFWNFDIFGINILWTPGAPK